MPTIDNQHAENTPAPAEALSREQLEAPSDLNMPPCANCGKPWSQAKEHRTAAMYDGEWVCSKACEDEHEELGCPFEHGENYRMQFELRAALAGSPS